MPKPEEESLLFNRRSFLKTGGLALGATVVAGDTAAANAASASAKPASQSTAVRNPVSLVNLLMGTESTRRFSRGNTLPIAARPFGMAHWTLQSEADTAWMFQPGNRRIQGFSFYSPVKPLAGRLWPRHLYALLWADRCRCRHALQFVPARRCQAGAAFIATAAVAIRRRRRAYPYRARRSAHGQL